MNAFLQAMYDTNVNLITTVVVIKKFTYLIHDYAVAVHEYLISKQLASVST